MNKQSAGLLHQFGTVLKPLIMPLGLDVGKVSMTGMQDVTNSKMVNHQTRDHLDFGGIYSTAQILRKSSSKGIAKIESLMYTKIH